MSEKDKLLVGELYDINNVVTVGNPCRAIKGI